ncbi:PiggyBac transposable element-derived protein 4 [Pseudolycoriella hygida]|uniref:PiggyBac transposable element-derived protein 4 n=1 Tax=Pseudolycoriella hygida TaxID=35572 RepID=A0A9Q0NBM2_9DIPT|nr:PiggyBac transposable element-derived protein 4 [Pseudolycoriella hygida]
MNQERASKFVMSDDINHIKVSIEKAIEALDLCNEFCYKNIVWEMFIEHSKEMDRICDGCDRQSGQFFSQLKCFFLEVYDHFLSATQIIYEWCDLTMRLLKIFVDLFKKQLPLTYETQKDLLTMVLGNGLSKIGKVNSEIEECIVAFTAIIPSLEALGEQLLIEYNPRGIYFKTKMVAIISNRRSTLPFLTRVFFPQDSVVISELLEEGEQMKDFVREIKQRLTRAKFIVEDVSKKFRILINDIFRLPEVSKVVISPNELNSFRDIVSDPVFKLIIKCHEYQAWSIEISKNTFGVFKTSTSLNYSPIFPATMSGRRFQILLRTFCCHMPMTKAEVDSSKLSRVTPLLQKLLKSFNEAFVPYKELSLDESLLLWRGRLSFRQFIKDKAAKYGNKFYELSSDGYVLNAIIYQGKNESELDDKTSKTAKIVFQLMQPYLDKVIIYTWTAFIIVYLFRHNCYRDKPIQRERFVLTEKRCGDVYVNKWKDKRDVLSISTAHHRKLVEVKNRHGQSKMKPQNVADYNQYMSGIDRLDQMISYHSSTRKTVRWYKKVLLHLIDVSVWNAFFLRINKYTNKFRS